MGWRKGPADYADNFLPPGINLRNLWQPYATLHSNFTQPSDLDNPYSRPRSSANPFNRPIQE